jgi:hypothetical protein
MPAAQVDPAEQVAGPSFPGQQWHGKARGARGGKAGKKGAAVQYVTGVAHAADGAGTVPVAPVPEWHGLAGPIAGGDPAISARLPENGDFVEPDQKTVSRSGLVCAPGGPKQCGFRPE